MAPTVQFLVYYLVIGQILRMHERMPLFPLYLFCGLVLVNLFNETLAAGFVEACLEESEAPLVRTIQREHLQDEVQHARVGWAHLSSASVDAKTRREIARFLPRLLGANLALWRKLASG